MTKGGKESFIVPTTKLNCEKFTSQPMDQEWKYIVEKGDNRNGN